MRLRVASFSRRRSLATMTSLVGKIQDIELEISRTQINKQTMAHLCGLRAKLAKYKRELLEPAKGAGGGGAGEGFDVRATGDARVGFVGFPSVGKSTLLTSLTDVYSEAASYEFTTLTCVPGERIYVYIIQPPIAVALVRSGVA